MGDIVLTGPKHSGKTSAGKALALLCSGGFFDTDELILQKTGKSPRQLYKENPANFQKAEIEAIMALAGISSAGKEWRVIAAGGGIIDNSEAVEILKKSDATMVYLNISAAAAWRRIVNSPDRELPFFLQTKNPRETHRILHEQRAVLYQQLAGIIIEAEGKTPEKIASEILEKIS